MAKSPPEQPAARATPRGIPDANVVAPAKYGLAEAGAWKAIHQGNATKDQQILALNWLLEGPCGLHDLQYRPGADGERDTAFALGKRYVGQQIVKLIRVDMESLRKRTPENG